VGEEGRHGSSGGWVGEEGRHGSSGGWVGEEGRHGGAGGWVGEEGPNGKAGGTRLLLLDEPTRGVDVGARAELYQLVRSLAELGVGVLLVSSEVPEVLGLADRVLVMRQGRIIHEAPASELDEALVLDMVMAGSLRADFDDDRETLA
jgi:hypothetical protein